MSPTKSAPKLVFGGFAIGPGDSFKDEESIAEVYTLLEAAGVDTIDTARLYGPSEEWMGKTGAGTRFIIDSKTPGGFTPGGSTSETIPQHAKETLERLRVDQVDVYHIHAPDASVPLEDQLRGINTAYKAGHFRRFGLSNFTAADVQRVYNICKEKGYPLPTVYQANYSALARRNEEVLVPTLRKLGMAFYVYSPIAGGLLTKTAVQLREGGEGSDRFAKVEGKESLYGGLYNKPSYYKALDMCKAELAYRWVAFDSIVDGKYGQALQIPDTVSWLKQGSVGEKAKARIDEIWEVVKDDAPLDSYNR
ncbi:NADP-dependent oxidoreductase domain-containing protein [Mycena filopes]|nr:NADP-dependent oxidoreductase domain-containing protein [Mycena filopes]